MGPRCTPGNLVGLVQNRGASGRVANQQIATTLTAGISVQRGNIMGFVAARAGGLVALLVRRDSTHGALSPHSAQFDGGRWRSPGWEINRIWEHCLAGRISKPRWL